MECSEKPVFYNYTGQELAQIRIMPPDEAVRKLVKKHWDTLAKPLDGTERLRLMHGMLNMDGTNKFHFNWKDLVPSGLSVKDAIAPTALALSLIHI